MHFQGLFLSNSLPSQNSSSLPWAPAVPGSLILKSLYHIALESQVELSGLGTLILLSLCRASPSV